VRPFARCTPPPFIIAGLDPAILFGGRKEEARGVMEIRLGNSLNAWLTFQSGLIHGSWFDGASACFPSMWSLAFSPIMMVGPFRLPLVTCGMMDESATRKASMPITRASAVRRRRSEIVWRRPSGRFRRVQGLLATLADEGIDLGIGRGNLGARLDFLCCIALHCGLLEQFAGEAHGAAPLRQVVRVGQVVEQDLRCLDAPRCSAHGRNRATWRASAPHAPGSHGRGEGRLAVIAHGGGQEVILDVGVFDTRGGTDEAGRIRNDWWRRGRS